MNYNTLSYAVGADGAHLVVARDVQRAVRPEGEPAGDAETAGKRLERSLGPLGFVAHGHARGLAGQRLVRLGDPGHEHYRVRWEDEHESIVYPADGISIIHKKHR